MALLDFRDADTPPDETPPADPPGPAPDDATEEAPYGYTPTGRIRKRPVGSRANTGGAGASRGNEALAASAASLLAQMNSIVGLSLAAFKLPVTAEKIGEANENFETMARNALAGDPKLCRRILSGGVSSSKAGLTMAYVALGIAIIPSAQTEIKERRTEMRAAKEAEYDDTLPGA